MIGCIKFFNSIFAFINFAVGAAILGGGIYFQQNKAEFWDVINQPQYDDYYKFGCIGLICFGAVVIICSFFGIYGSCYKKKCALTIYSFSVIILFVIFVGVGVLLIIFFNPWYNSIKDDLDCQSDKKSLEFLKQANDLYNQGANTLYCKTYTQEYQGQTVPIGGECPCYISNRSAWENKFGSNFFDPYLITDKKDDGVITVEKCEDPTDPQVTSSSEWEEYQQLLEEWSPLGKFIEENFHCSGICDPQPFYFFSDINNGVPKNNEYTNNQPNVGTGCITEISDFVGWFKNIALLVSFAAAGFMFLNIAMSCCICCYSSKDRDANSYVQMGQGYYH